MAEAKLGLAPWLLALLCAALASLGFFDSTAGLTIQLALAIPFGATAILLVRLALKPPSSHPFIRALRERREDIVWIHATEHLVRRRVANHFLGIGLRDGTQYALAVSPKRSTALMQRLRELAPQAAEGYSAERAEQFRSDPASLMSARKPELGG